VVGVLFLLEFKVYRFVASEEDSAEAVLIPLLRGDRGNGRSTAWMRANVRDGCGDGLELKQRIAQFAKIRFWIS